MGQSQPGTVHTCNDRGRCGVGQSQPGTVHTYNDRGRCGVGQNSCLMMFPKPRYKLITHNHTPPRFSWGYASHLTTNRQPQPHTFGKFTYVEIHNTSLDRWRTKYDREYTCIYTSADVLPSAGGDGIPPCKSQPYTLDCKSQP